MFVWTHLLFALGPCSRTGETLGGELIEQKLAGLLP